MKRLNLLIATLIGATSFVSAQTAQHNYNVGLQVGSIHYDGDLGGEFYKFGDVHPAIGITGSKYISPLVDLGGSFKHGMIDRSTFETSIFDFNLFIKFKANNGKLLKEDAKIAPYVFAGLGDAISKTTDLTTNTTGKSVVDFNFPLGVGFNIPLNERWNANVESHYNYSFSDFYDNNTSMQFGDQFLFNTIGVSYNFSPGKDSDGDGISDKKDACPTVAGLAKFNGCPDSDNDGIVDAEDACPKVAGLSQFNGCPDTDGDGVKDSEDKCPNIKGLTTLNGCPDTDGDGITDAEDACPKVAGELKFNGCLDTDFDGIGDNKDKCPDVKGVAEMNGCPLPDADKDGVADKFDKCPKIPGIKANEGCPEIKEEAKATMQRAKEGLFFNSGSAKIKTTSYRVLNDVYTILSENPTYKLDIEGHTDSSGDAAKNLQLSKDRAHAAEQYLIKKGIAAERLMAEGYGITRPIADNKTQEGKAKNRRVEFTIHF